MNRIIRENFPVSQLPEDLQREFAGQDEVTLTVETKARSKPDFEGPEPPYGRGAFSRYRHLVKDRFHSADAVVAYVRDLRDEWNDRDQELTRLRDR